MANKRGKKSEKRAQKNLYTYSNNERKKSAKENRAQRVALMQVNPSPHNKIETTWKPGKFERHLNG